MRIFCAIRHSNDPSQFYGGLWSGNFYPALRELGLELVESQVDLLPTSRFMFVADDFTPEEREVRAQTTEQILKEVHAALRNGPVDLFLSYFYNAHFDPDGFDELHRLGIPTVNFYCNSIHQFELVAAIATKVDFSWHTERDARAFYLAVGANPVWVQMGADPKLYSPTGRSTRKKKAVFIGQRYADRDRLMAALIQAGIPVDIFGAGWGADVDSSEPSPNSCNWYLGRAHTVPGRWISYRNLIFNEIRHSGLLQGVRRLKAQASYRQDTCLITKILRSHAKGRASDLREVFSSYEVCLNFSNVWADGRPGSRLIPHVRLRDFEAPMCRTCYLTGHTTEITEFYEVGREIDTYCTADELVDKARFYLAHPDAAEKMREAGYRRALRDHTWKQRFYQLFKHVNLSETR